MAGLIKTELPLVYLNNVVPVLVFNESVCMFNQRAKDFSHMCDRTRVNNSFQYSKTIMIRCKLNSKIDDRTMNEFRVWIPKTLQKSKNH